MKIKLILIAVITMIAISSIAGLVVANSSNDDQSTPSSTPPPVNVDWCFPASEAVAKPASFQASISENQAISTVRDIVREWFYPKPEDLPTTATLATFTGTCQDAQGTKVQDLPVWIVVIKGLPDISSGGAAPMPDQNYIYQPRSCQINEAIDASTGVVIYGVISGKIIDTDSNVMKTQ